MSVELHCKCGNVSWKSATPDRITVGCPHCHTWVRPVPPSDEAPESDWAAYYQLIKEIPEWDAEEWGEP